MRKPDKEVGPGKVERGCGQSHGWLDRRTADAVDRGKWRKVWMETGTVMPRAVHFAR